MELQDVILKAMAKKITWHEAVEILAVCYRTTVSRSVETGLVNRFRG